MSSAAQITFTGNATADAEIRFVGSGAAVANVTVAVTPREKVGDTWQDGQAAFYRVAAWRKLGENVAESVKRGTRVTVVGTLKPREFEHNGEKRMSLDVAADHVGVELRFATVSVTKAQRQQGGQQQQPAQGGSQWGGQAQQADPWAGQQAGTGGGWGGGMPAGTGPHDEPPFAK